MLIISGGKSLSCLPTASENETPVSTSSRTSAMIFASRLLSTWSARIVRVRSSDRPEPIMVAIWRDMTAMSFILTARSPRPGIDTSRCRPVPAPASLIEIGCTPIVRRRVMTAPSLEASTLPLTTLPAPSRPL
jgi:hypothetical protein